MTSRRHSLGLAMAALLLAGCANVDPRRGFPAVEEDARQRLGANLAWSQDAEEDAAIRAQVSRLLAQPLSPDVAVQIALLQNPDLQATYEALGVAAADLVQAGLLSNPVLVAAPRPGVGSVSGTNLELDIAQNLLQLLTLRSRKELATRQFEEARLRVSHQVIELAAEVRDAWYERVAALHLLSVLRSIEETASLASEYATRLHRAGNVSNLALARERALFEEARIARQNAEAAAIAPREQLARLLGRRPPQALETPETLPPLPAMRVRSEGLEALALANRLDLRALEKEIEAFEQALALARFYRWIPFVEVGVSAEREAEGGWVVGPQLALEIPIFDQGQAQVARFESMVRERRRHHEALLLDVRRDVRTFSEAVRARRHLAEEYLRTLIPLRERIVRLTQAEYNYMLVGAFELLSAKRDEIASYEQYVEALRRYWVSRAGLERAVGGALPTEPAEPAEAEAAPEPLAVPGIEPDADDHGAHGDHGGSGHGAHAPEAPPEKRAPSGHHHHEGHDGE